MEKRSSDNQMYDEKFMDSMNTVQSYANYFSNREISGINITYLWNEFENLVPVDNLKKALDYFIVKEDNYKNRETIDALGLLLSYAKDRHSGEMGTEIYDYVLEASKKMGGFDRDKEKALKLKEKNNVEAKVA